MTNGKRVGLVGLGALLLLGIGGAAAWSATHGERPREGAAAVGKGEPARVAAEPTSSPANAEPAPARDAWRAKRDRIRAALGRRAPVATPAAVEPPGAEPQRCTEGCWGTLQLQLRLAGVIDGCRELLPPEARGTARFDAKVIADPEVGAVVESVEVVEDGIGVEELRDCIVESSLLAELADPDDPVSDTFRFRFSAGPPADNAASFLGANPQLVERYPQLAALRDRPLDAPRSDEDATLFASVIAGDAEALGAFERWSVDQGIDLSGVRAEE